MEVSVQAAALTSRSNTPANVRRWPLTHPCTVSVTFDFCYYRPVKTRCFIWQTCANSVRIKILPWAAHVMLVVSASVVKTSCACICVSDKQTHSSTLPPAASVAMLPQVSRGCAVGWSQCRNYTAGYTDGTESSFTAFIQCQQRKRQRRVLCAETRAGESSRIDVRTRGSESFQQQISSVIRLIQSKWSAFVSVRYSM